MSFQFAYSAQWNIERRKEILEMVMLLEPMLDSRIGIGAQFVHEIENRFIWDRCGFENSNLRRAIVVHRVV